jgi:hypothetical protein
MADIVLIPEQTIEAKGVGPELELGDAAGRKLLVTLAITRQIEQESLDVSVWGSEDKTNWGTTELLAFPQKFYIGESQLLLDLTPNPQVKYLRGQWEANRWGKGRPTPRFTFSVRLRVV